MFKARLRNSVSKGRLKDLQPGHVVAVKTLKGKLSHPACKGKLWHPAFPQSCGLDTGRCLRQADVAARRHRVLISRKSLPMFCSKAPRLFPAGGCCRRLPGRPPTKSAGGGGDHEVSEGTTRQCLGHAGLRHLASTHGKHSHKHWYSWSLPRRICFILHYKKFTNDELFLSKF